MARPRPRLAPVTLATLPSSPEPAAITSASRSVPPAELPAQDLADGALRQRIHEPDLLRTLEPRESRLAEGDHVLGGGVGAVPQYDERARLLSHQWVGHAYDRRFRHGRKRVEGLLDFSRVDVESAANDEVLLPLDDVEESIGIQPTHVARVKPALADRTRGLLGILVVPDHHVRPLDTHLAHVARRHHSILIVLDRDLDAWDRLTYRS